MYLQCVCIRLFITNFLELLGHTTCQSVLTGGGGGRLSPYPLCSDGPGEMLVNKFAKGKTEHYSYLGFIWLAHSKLCVKSQLIFEAQIFFSHSKCQEVVIQRNCSINRAVGRSANPGVPVLFGRHNLPPLVEIGLTDLPMRHYRERHPALP